MKNWHTISNNINCTCLYSKDDFILSNNENASFFCSQQCHDCLNSFIHEHDETAKKAQLNTLRALLLKERIENGCQQNRSNSIQETNALQEVNSPILQCKSDNSEDLLRSKHMPNETCALIYSEAFWIACYTGNLNFAIFLLLLAKECGVEIKVWGSNGWTPFLAAYSMGHMQVAKLLTENDYFENVDESSRQGNTALLLAIWNGKNSGLTALHQAVEKNDITAVKRLVYIINVDEQDNLGRTALYMAACFGHVEIFRILYSVFADENIADNKGETARHIAIKNGNDDIIDILDCKIQSPAIKNNPILSEEILHESVNVCSRSAASDETAKDLQYKKYTKNKLLEKVKVGCLLNATDTFKIFPELRSILKRITLPIVDIIASVYFKIRNMKNNPVGLTTVPILKEAILHTLLRKNLDTEKIKLLNVCKSIAIFCKLKTYFTSYCKSRTTKLNQVLNLTTSLKTCWQKESFHNVSAGKENFLISTEHSTLLFASKICTAAPWSYCFTPSTNVLVSSDFLPSTFKHELTGKHCKYTRRVTGLLSVYHPIHDYGNSSIFNFSNMKQSQASTSTEGECKTNIMKQEIIKVTETAQKKKLLQYSSLLKFASSRTLSSDISKTLSNEQLNSSSIITKNTNIRLSNLEDVITKEKHKPKNNAIRERFEWNGCFLSTIPVSLVLALTQNF